MPFQKTARGLVRCVITMLCIALGAGCALEVEGVAPYDDEFGENEVLTDELTYSDCTVTSPARYLGQRNLRTFGALKFLPGVSGILYEAGGTGTGCASACAAWAGELNQLPEFRHYGAAHTWNGSVCTVYLYEGPPSPRLTASPPSPSRTASPPPPSRASRPRSLPSWPTPRSRPL